MIEKPIATRSRPMPTVQRRSKPVNGSVLAVVELAFAGEVPLVAAGVLSAGVPVAGELASLDGEVPLAGVGVVFDAGVLLVGVVVGGGAVVPYPASPVVAAIAVVGNTSAAASSSANERTKSLRDARDDPLLIGAAPAACGLPEATTLVRVMPTSS
jgi:hypothetical protein